MEIELISRGFVAAILERALSQIPSIDMTEYQKGQYDGIDYALAVLYAAWTEPKPEPKVIPAREGTWSKFVVYFDNGKPKAEMRCSICERPSDHATNYCPHCGAKMMIDRRWFCEAD